MNILFMFIEENAKWFLDGVLLLHCYILFGLYDR